jgi:hypothetical protein
MTFDPISASSTVTQSSTITNILTHMVSWTQSGHRGHLQAMIPRFVKRQFADSAKMFQARHSASANAT